MRALQSKLVLLWAVSN